MSVIDQPTLNVTQTQSDARQASRVLPTDCVDQIASHDARTLLDQHAQLDTSRGIDGLWPNRRRLSASRELDQARLLCGPVTDPEAVHPPLRLYLSSVESHCPLLAAARTKGQLLLSSYEPGAGASAGVFAAICAAAEDVRVRRREVGALACAMVAFAGVGVSGGAGDLVAFPAWLARWLYAPAGLMVNAFEPGEPRPSRHGRLVPAPPIVVVVIRVGVPEVDVQLQGDRAGRDLISAAVDDGRDVVAGVLGAPAAVLGARTVFRELTVRAVVSSTQGRLA